MPLLEIKMKHTLHSDVNPINWKPQDLYQEAGIREETFTKSKISDLKKGHQENMYIKIAYSQNCFF